MNPAVRQGLIALLVIVGILCVVVGAWLAYVYTRAKKKILTKQEVVSDELRDDFESIATETATLPVKKYNPIEVRTKVIVYDDLSPTGAINWIAKHKNLSQFVDTWSKFDQMKFHKILELLQNYQQKLVDFTLIKLNFDQLQLLTRLQEAEAVDFVLNQYNIYSNDAIKLKIIKPVNQELKIIPNLNEANLVNQIRFQESKRVKKFKQTSFAYFHQQKVKNVFDQWKLRQMLVNKNQSKQKFIDYVEKITNQQQAAIGKFQKISTQPIRFERILKESGKKPNFWQERGQ